jgi:hypothetical protein
MDTLDGMISLCCRLLDRLILYRFVIVLGVAV